jgi:putative FmdB family regulatory protein
MARYDYKCSACGNVFEVEHPMGEKPEISCPSCGAHADRVFDPSGISFQGSGFYNTDMRGSTSISKRGGDTLAKSSDCPKKCPGCSE